MLGCSGRTTSSPEASREKATRPGPWATVMTMGMPPSMRFSPPRDRHGGQRRALVLPEQHVVLEEHPVALGQVDLGHRHQLALDLAGAVGEPELGHVPEPGRLLPPRVADQVAGVERRPARRTGRLADVVLGLAPLALDAVHGGGRYQHVRRADPDRDLSWSPVQSPGRGNHRTGRPFGYTIPGKKHLVATSEHGKWLSDPVQEWTSRQEILVNHWVDADVVKVSTRWRGFLI